MARELEFAFGNEMPQAPELGANYFQDPYLPLQASLEKMLSSSWGSCPSAESPPPFLYKEERWGCRLHSGDRMRMYICPPVTGLLLYSLVLQCGPQQ